MIGKPNLSLPRNRKSQILAPLFTLAILTMAALWVLGPIPNALGAMERGVVYRYHQTVTLVATPYVYATSYFDKASGTVRKIERGANPARIHPRKTAADKWFGWTVARRYLYLRDRQYGMLSAKALLGTITFLLVFGVLKKVGHLLLKVLLVPVMLYTAYKRQQPSDAHGSAKWARPSAIARLAPVPTEPGFVLGTYKPDKWYRGKHSVNLPLVTQNQHVLVLGPPGTLKTNSMILRNLLCEAGSRSVVITDFKGELRELAYGYLNEVFKGRVYIYDPYDPRFDRYNPLDFIHNVDDARRFAESIIANTGESAQEPFWQNVNQAMIVGAVMHLKASYGERSVPLADLANFLSRPIQDIVKDYEKSRNDVARERAHYLLNEIRMNEKLRASVTSELTIRWDWLLEPAVRQSSAETTIPFGELSKKPMAVFLMLNAEKSQSLRPLMSNLWSHIFSNIAASARTEIDGRFLTAGGLSQTQIHTQQQTAFYLDEFTNIGRIPLFSDHLKTVRSAKASLFIVVQTLYGIDKLYDRGVADEVYEVCATKIVLGGTSGKDAKFISEELGHTTVVSKSSNRSRLTSEVFRGQAGQTTSETQRVLIEAVQIRERADKLVAVIAGQQSMLLDKDPYYNHRDLVRRTKTTYALERYAIRELPADPGLKWHGANSEQPSGGKSDDEHRVLELLDAGRIQQEIAAELDISPIEVSRIISDARKPRALRDSDTVRIDDEGHISVLDEVLEGDEPNEQVR